MSQKQADLPHKTPYFAFRYCEPIALVLLGAAAVVPASLIADNPFCTALGGLFAAVILTPPLIARHGDWPRRAESVVAILVGIFIPWLAAARSQHVTLAEGIKLSAILAGVSIALLGCVVFLRRIGLTAPLAAGFTVLLGVAWMSWPVWLSPLIAGGGSPRWVGVLVRVHPPLVANGVLTQTPPWTEMAVAYRLTVLDQDVPIRLPTEPWHCIAAHLAVGALLISLSSIRAKKST